MARFAGTLIGAFALALVSAEAATLPPQIAILQDSPGGVRLGFVKIGNDWQPLCAFPKESSQHWACQFKPIASQWHVRYRGRELGTVATSDWADPATDPGVGLLKITSGAPPRIGKPGHAFSGWLDKPGYRPLVVTNTSIADSKPVWLSAKPETAEAAAALAFLGRHVGKIPDCGKDGEPTGAGRAIAARDIHISEIWRSGAGAQFYGASLDPRLVANCNYTADALADVWLHTDGSAEPMRVLPALVEDETTHALVDIGDFAGDGGEEALFALSGYDEDGFILYYDSFRKSARISWHYN